MIYGKLGVYQSEPYDFTRIKNDIDSRKFKGLSTRQDLLKAFSMPLNELVELAMSIRRKRLQDGVKTDFCSSGYLPHEGGKGCEMSCSFCGFPRAIYKDGSREFISKLNVDEIIRDAKKKRSSGATRYKIVSLGCFITKEEYRVALDAIPKLYDIGFEKVCLSFGSLPETSIKDIVSRFGRERIELNHNLEVGTEKAYKSLIGNNPLLWKSRYNTVLSARKHGLDVCSGGLVGIGETPEEQADLVMALRALNVTSAPFNVFVLEDDDNSIVAQKIRKGEISRPTSETIIRTLCMWRLGLPKSSIAANSGFGLTGKGDFGRYSGLIELSLINDKVSVPNKGFLSKRRY